MFWSLPLLQVGTCKSKLLRTSLNTDNSRITSWLICQGSTNTTGVQSRLSPYNVGYFIRAQSLKRLGTTAGYKNLYVCWKATHLHSILEAASSVHLRKCSFCHLRHVFIFHCFHLDARFQTSRWNKCWHRTFLQTQNILHWTFLYLNIFFGTFSLQLYVVTMLYLRSG